jgi:hypothetical protein
LFGKLLHFEIYKQNTFDQTLKTTNMKTKLLLLFLITFLFANSQTISTRVGSTPEYVEGTSTTARFNRPYGIAIDGGSAVAVGGLAGYLNQGNAAVAIGPSAGSGTQGLGAVAVGWLAGTTAQGANAVAIGVSAGRTSQANNSIIINATGANLNQTTANTFTVKPVRAVTSVTFAAPTAGSIPVGFSPVYYNPTTGELIVITP